MQGLIVTMRNPTYLRQKDAYASYRRQENNHKVMLITNSRRTTRITFEYFVHDVLHLFKLRRGL
jgi:hypothetical protein